MTNWPPGWHALLQIKWRHVLIIFLFITGSLSLCENAEVVAQVPARWPLHPSYFHSFAMTDNYYAIIETPFAVDVLKILVSKYLRIPIIHCLKYYENYPVINREYSVFNCYH